MKRGQIQALFRTLSFGIILKVVDISPNSRGVDFDIKGQQLSVCKLEYEECPHLSHCLVIDKSRIADRIHPLKIIVATMIRVRATFEGHIEGGRPCEVLESNVAASGFQGQSVPLERVSRASKHIWRVRTSGTMPNAQKTVQNSRFGFRMYVLATCAQSSKHTTLLGPHCSKSLVTGWVYDTLKNAEKSRLEERWSWCLKVASGNGNIHIQIREPVKAYLVQSCFNVFRGSYEIVLFSVPNTLVSDRIA